MRDAASRILAARARLLAEAGPPRLDPEAAAEGGCGVVGLASDVPVAGRHLLPALCQMRNRGNGKGGGVAMVGLDPGQMGVSAQVLADVYLLGLAFLDPAVRAEAEARYLDPEFEVDATRTFGSRAPEGSLPGLDVAPPEVVVYFARPRAAAVERFLGESGLSPSDFADRGALEDELVYRWAYRLNRELYAGSRGNLAYVQCHGKDLLVLKMVAYAEDVIRWYGLEEATAHVWIGHHRYPTKGKVWHPGGAHPFVGQNEALVHNGDFANYQSICDYLAQRGIRPLFMTDTEVAALVYDLHRRTYGYPLEYVIESLAPTTERDFTLLPPARQRVYRALQAAHIHGSPDGPWFFILAESDRGLWRLAGITDTSMLRPQVFALQRGEASIAFCASEKQVIDAVLESLAAEDARFWPRPDQTWVARGGSHTDGGAFVFTVEPAPDGRRLVVTDKFGTEVEPREGGDAAGPSPRREPLELVGRAGAGVGAADAEGAEAGDDRGRAGFVARSSTSPPLAALRGASGSGAGSAFDPVTRALSEPWTWEDAAAFCAELRELGKEPSQRRPVLGLLTRLLDRRYDAGGLRRSRWLSLLDDTLVGLVADLEAAPCAAFRVHAGPGSRPHPDRPDQAIVLDARRYHVEGPGSAALELVALHRQGFRRLIVVEARGHRFLGCGLGPMGAAGEAGGNGHGGGANGRGGDGTGNGAAGKGPGDRGARATWPVALDVYGSPGDYLGSGADGLAIAVHGDGQDQLAQILRRGLLVVHGDVGQAFGYGAKGGEVYVLGSAAGRPMINAVGSPRVVINGTCLDYLAESFMAGDPLDGGGFMVVNGVAVTPAGEVVDLPTPYPGGNLFSLASGGALYVRDPHGRVDEGQLNGGELVSLAEEDWSLVRPHLEENEALFGIPLERLLTVDGRLRPWHEVYRKVRPVKHQALQAEEAWVGHRG